jgi:hypothetical protein
MNSKVLSAIDESVENEGFHYTFTDWDELPGMDDDGLKAAVRNYRDATADLTDYLARCGLVLPD